MKEPEKSLIGRWQSLFRERDRGMADETFRLITTAYGQPQRHYHTLQHIAECLSEEEVFRTCLNPLDVTAAIFFHDIVYDPTSISGANERASALECTSFCSRRYRLGWWRDRVGPDGRVWEASWDILPRWIMLTAHADAPHKGTTLDDSSYFLDIDLSILGKPPERFWEYETQIRKEYAHVPQDIYRAVRAGILQRFLGRDRIYTTPLMQDKYEVQARKNLTESIAKLTS